MSNPIGTPAHISESSQLPSVHEKVPLAKIVNSNFHIEHPEFVTFQQLIRYHDRTPQIQIAVSSYSELITGTEMNITCNSDNATKFLEDWIKRTNFHEKFENLVTTNLICGNALLEKLDEKGIEDVMEVDMSTIIGKKRNEVGELQYYEARTQNSGTDKLGDGKLGKFIEFNLTNYSRQPWGKSLFYSLAIPRTVGNRTTLPLIEIMWGVEDAMGAILLNNAYPITTITYASANDAYLEKEAMRWQRYKPGDKRVQKIKPEIEFFETQGSSKYTDFVTHLEKSFELGTQFPHDIMTGDFTSRASSETTDNIVMKRVRGYQRYLSSKLCMELFEPLLNQNGFNSDKEDCSVQFTAQNIIELEVSQVKDLKSIGVMSMNETREWLRTNTGMELPDDKEVAQDEQSKKDNEDQKMNDKANGFKNKFAPKESVLSMKDLADIHTATKTLRRCKMCKESQHALCTKKGCQCQ